MTKQVRVLKKMPFCKVGEEFPSDRFFYFVNPITGKTYGINDFIKEGYLEWVTEEKSLSSEIWQGCSTKVGFYPVNAENANKAAQIADRWYQKKFDKAVEKSVFENSIMQYDDNIRKSMFGGGE